MTDEDAKYETCFLKRTAALPSGLTASIEIFCGSIDIPGLKIRKCISQGICSSSVFE